VSDDLTMTPEKLGNGPWEVHRTQKLGTSEVSLTELRQVPKPGLPTGRTSPKPNRKLPLTPNRGERNSPALANNGGYKPGAG